MTVLELIEKLEELEYSENKQIVVNTFGWDEKQDTTPIKTVVEYGKVVEIILE